MPLLAYCFVGCLKPSHNGTECLEADIVINVLVTIANGNPNQFQVTIPAHFGFSFVPTLKHYLFSGTLLIAMVNFSRLSPL